MQVILLIEDTLTVIDEAGRSTSELRYQKSREGVMFVEPSGFKRWYSLKDINDNFLTWINSHK